VDAIRPTYHSRQKSGALVSRRTGGLLASPGAAATGDSAVLAGGVRHAARLAGIIALSTYLPLGEKTAAERTDANNGLPIFMGHGTIDNVVPEVLGTTSRNALETLGYAVEWHSYPMAHQVNAQEIADLRKWMASRLG
jgi:phospholipase/carboxylesterase